MIKWLELFLEYNGASTCAKIAKTPVINLSEDTFDTFGTLYQSQNPDILKWLNTLSHETRLLFEERAAIMEYDGGLSREEAEKMAIGELIN